MTGADDAGVSVDLDSLATFLDFVGLEIDGNVSPTVSEVHTEATTGATWGGLDVPGLIVGESHASYANAQALMVNNMVSYMMTGLALLKTMNYLLVTYKTTDEMAKASIAKVQAKMAEQLVDEQHAFLAAHGYATPGSAI